MTSTPDEDPVRTEADINSDPTVAATPLQPPLPATPELATPEPAPPAAPAPSAAPRARRRTPEPPSPAPTATLCIDVGGSGVKGGTVVGGKLLADSVRIAMTYPCPPERLVEMISQIAAQSPPAARVSVGFPGAVRAGAVLFAPHFTTKTGPGSALVPSLVKAWTGFGLAKAVERALSLPTRLANDADTQGLGAITGKGLELVITLGTGFGSAIFLDGEVAPHIELAHHPLHGGKTYNEWVGDAARRKVGAKRWSKRVQEAVSTVKALVFYDKLYVGGGNAGHLTKAFTHEATIIPNADGILGGEKLWSLNRLP